MSPKAISTEYVDEDNEYLSETDPDQAPAEDDNQLGTPSVSTSKSKKRNKIKSEKKINVKKVGTKVGKVVSQQPDKPRDIIRTILEKCWYAANGYAPLLDKTVLREKNLVSTDKSKKVTGQTRSDHESDMLTQIKQLTQWMDDLRPNKLLSSEQKTTMSFRINRIFMQSPEPIVGLTEIDLNKRLEGHDVGMFVQYVKGGIATKRRWKDILNELFTSLKSPK